MCKQLGACAVVSSWCKACKTKSNIKAHVFLVSTAKFCPRIRRNKTYNNQSSKPFMISIMKIPLEVFCTIFCWMLDLFQEPPLGNVTNVHRPWADVYRFGALVVVPILTHLGQGAVNRHHDDRPWNFRISSQHPQWTLIACAKHGDSSAKMRGCQMPKISSTILPLHSQTINMLWRWGRTCWCWWNRKIMQVANIWAEWMFISLQNASQMIIKNSS